MTDSVTKREEEGRQRWEPTPKMITDTQRGLQLTQRIITDTDDDDGHRRDYTEGNYSQTWRSETALLIKLTTDTTAPIHLLLSCDKPTPSL